MGSYNQTCMLTQVPIRHGDKVKFFMLRGKRWFPTGKRTDYGTTVGQCNSTDLWEPFGPPFSAKYNDYGAVEDWDEKDPAFQLVAEYFKKQHSLAFKEVLQKIHKDESFHLAGNVGANDCLLFYC